jgi:hypothetical protein
MTTRLRFSAVICLSVIAFACDSEDPVQPDPVPASVSIQPGAVSLQGPGDTTTVSARVIDSDGGTMSGETITWSSADPSIVTISNQGLITAVAEGSAGVVASSGSLSASSAVTVEGAVLSGPSGGDIQLGSDSVTLSIPAGALSDDAFLTAEPATGLPTQPAAIPGTAFDFGPDGLVFDQPVLVTITYDPANVPASVPESELRLHKLVANGYELLDSAAVDTVANTVSGYISSFSVYGAVRRLGIATEQLPGGGTGVSYPSTALAVKGGNGSYEWSVAEGALPDGLSLSSNGVISGTPLAADSFSFVIRVVSGAQVAERAYEIAIVAGVEIVTSLLPSWVTGEAKSVTLEASGGGGDYEWSLIDGSLPAGLTLSTDGTITGITSAVEEQAFTVEVQASTGQTDTAEFTIFSWDPLVFFDGGVPPVLLGFEFGTSLQASGGDGIYVWSVLEGTLPAGLELDTETGMISGTPTEVGGSTVTIQVSTGDGQTDSGPFEIPVVELLQITTDSLPSGVVGEPYSVTLTATGGDLTYFWSLESGSLPTGLTLSDQGVISGTPTSADSSTFTVQVTSEMQMISREWTIPVFNPLTIGTTSLTEAMAGEAAKGSGDLQMFIPGSTPAAPVAVAKPRPGSP